MVVVVFRSRVRAGCETEIERMGTELYELASATPGFIGYREYIAEDGENVSLVEFDSHEALAAWRDHPDHRFAQAAGRDRLFDDYQIQVCDMVREYSFNR